MINKAIIMATKAHSGQVDKAGKPYIFHVLRVGMAGRTEAEMVVGFLHDTLEDTGLTHTEILEAFGPRIMQAVLSVTRMPGETYAAFIERAKLDPIGKAVKINDLMDNLGRLGTLSDDVVGRLRKRYLAALKALGRIVVA